MKILFLFVSIVCALAVSALAFIFATDGGPFAAPVEEVVIMAPPRAPLTVFSGQKEILDVLIEELEAKTDDRIQDLAEREEALRIMESLKNEMVSLESEFDAVVLEVKASEEANFKRLADIFSRMESDGAATLLQQMEQERAAIILNLIGDRQAGAIMNAAAQTPAGADNAVGWSDAIRRLSAGSKGG